MGSMDLLLNHRLRHLSGLSVHNLVMKEDEEPPFSVCFALSLPQGDDLDFFFRSYDEWNCLHPEWKFIDLRNCNHVQQVTKDFVVSVVIRFKNTGYCRLMRQWRIHITGLSCLGQEAPPVGSFRADEETLIIQFGDFHYTTYQTDIPVSPTYTMQADEVDGKIKKLDVKLLYRADESSVRETYGLSLLLRLMSLFERTMESRESMREEHERCEAVYSQCQMARQQKADLEAKRSKMLMLKQQVELTRERIKLQRLRLQTLREINNEKDVQLMQLRADNKTKSEDLLTGCNVYQRMKSDLKEYQIQIVRRRIVLARALQVVYPIKKISSNNGPRFTICGLEMPNSDLSFSETTLSDNHLTAAYGFAAQLLRVISYIADVPLRYPIIVHSRSRLYMRDNIVCQLSQEERNFPLHLRRARNDRLRFAYAVFLLNRDVTLLRLSCGLNLKNVSTTLSNLAELLRSPLSPSCSAETYHTAEKLVEETSLIPVFSSEQQSISAPILEQSILKPNSSSAASNVNSDIYKHNNVTDVTS